jgi:signal transduction histidine kinase/CHASE3 domain sensor protein
MSAVRPIGKVYRSTPVMMVVFIGLVAALVLTGTYTAYLGSKAYDNIQRATILLLDERGAYSLLIDMETGTRGYIITGDAQFLQPFNDARAQLPGLWNTITLQISQLDEDAASKNDLSNLVDTAKGDAGRWQTDWAEKEIELRRTNNTAAAMSTPQNQTGRQMFDAVRQEIQQLDSALGDRLGVYTASLNNIRQTELGLVIGLGVIALASGLLTLRASQRETQLQERITEQVDLERRRLQGVVDNLPVAVRLVEAPGSRVILQNAMADEMFPVDEWNSMTRPQRIEHYRMSKPDGALMSPDETPGARAVAEGRPVRDVELTIISGDSATGAPGSKRHLLCSAAPIRDSRGRITSIAIVLQDVTRMREIDQRKDEFIATAAHELRNPLAALSGYSQLVQKLVLSDSPNPALVERNLREISRQINRLNNLVERLLDASRIQLGRLILDKSRQDLVKIAESVVDELRATDSGAHAITLAAPAALTGCWDPLRIEQVITNLVGNALRHAPQASKVEVRLQGLDKEARVEVIDAGPGVPPEQRAHLFDRYYQTAPLSSGILTDKDRSAAGVGSGQSPQAPAQGAPRNPQKRQGLGLGLYISQEIIKAHHGRIGIDPNPDGGSIFWFTLPLGDC